MKVTIWKFGKKDSFFVCGISGLKCRSFFSSISILIDLGEKRQLASGPGKPPHIVVKSIFTQQIHSAK